MLPIAISDNNTVNFGDSARERILFDTVNYRQNALLLVQNALGSKLRIFRAYALSYILRSRIITRIPRAACELPGPESTLVSPVSCELASASCLLGAQKHKLWHSAFPRFTPGVGNPGCKYTFPARLIECTEGLQQVSLGIYNSVPVLVC